MYIPEESNRLRFSHEWESFLFRTDKPDMVFLDRCKYHTLTPTEYVDNQCMIELEDLRRILAPDMRIQRERDALRFELDCYLRYYPAKLKRLIRDGCCYWQAVETETAEMTLGSSSMTTERGEKELSAAPYEREGKVFVPVAELLELGFGAKIDRFTSGANTFWKKKVEVRSYTCVSFGESFKFSRDWLDTVMDPLARKEWGDVYETIWFEEGNRLMAYRLYVPYTYRADRPNKAILLFHGGGTNENTYYEDSDNRLQFYAEKYGYITIAPTSYSVSTFFGSLLPILQTLDGIDPKEADPLNPEGWPQATLDIRAMANRGAWVQLNYIFEHWNIDRRNLFGQGNSAGSNALTYFAITYPGLLKAIIPGAGWVNPNFADLTKLKSIPIMHLIGSEDHHGADYVNAIYKICDELGLSCKKVIVGGGTHFNAWTFIIDEMFEFYESNVTD